MMPDAISIRELKLQYSGAYAPALDGLSVTVPTGSIFGLLGPNGAGKTSTIHILCGLLRADSGSASAFGLDAWRDKDAIRRRIGVVPQHIALYPGLTGMENL